MMAASPLSTPPGNLTERRRVPRYNMALDIAFGPQGSAKAQGNEGLARTVTVNLGLGGLCLYSDMLYPIGARLICRLSIPHRKTPLEISGTVVWFQKVDQQSHAYKLGVEFLNLGAEEKSCLQGLFDKPPEADPSRSKRLLLVEDDEELRIALKLRFENSGFEVITADDGLEALQKGREEHPNLIILDIMLPRLNGYEVCRLLKFDQKYRHIPILVFTARSRQQDVEMGYAVGANAYIPKPFDGKALIEKVEELLKAAQR